CPTLRVSQSLSRNGRTTILANFNKISHLQENRVAHDLSQRVEASPGTSRLPVDFRPGPHSPDGTREQARSDRRQESRGEGVETPARRVQEAGCCFPGSKPEQAR